MIAYLIIFFLKENLMHLKASLIITMIRVLPEGIWQKSLLFLSSKQRFFCSYFSFSLFNFSSFILMLPSYLTKEKKCQFAPRYFSISGLLSSVKIGLYESRSSSFLNSLTTVGVHKVLYQLLITWLNNILLTKFLKKTASDIDKRHFLYISQYY